MTTGSLERVQHRRVAGNIFEREYGLKLRCGYRHFLLYRYDWIVPSHVSELPIKCEHTKNLCFQIMDHLNFNKSMRSTILQLH